MNKRHKTLKIKAYEYIETADGRLSFGTFRSAMDELLGKGESLPEGDFCENLGEVRLEFREGRFSAAVVPEGYNVFIGDFFLGSQFTQAVKKLEKYFAPLVKLENKGSVCCQKAGLICFNRGAGGRLFVCGRDYYEEYSEMLFFMEQCEQKASFNNV